MSAPLVEFLDCWGRGYLAHDIGTSLTCTEAEAIACLFLSVGRPLDAQTWIESHAEGDDCGDMHCRCTDCTTEEANP